MGLNKKRRKYKRRLPNRGKEPLLQPLFENITLNVERKYEHLMLLTILIVKL